MRKIVILSLVLVLILSLCSCSTYSSKSYTYNIDNSNSVKVKINNIDNDYDLMPDGSNFIVYKGDKIVIQGCFVNYETFELYKESAKQDEHTTILEETEEKFVYLYKIDDIEEYDTFRVIGNNIVVVAAGIFDENINKKLVEDALSKLSFSLY